MIDSVAVEGIFFLGSISFAERMISFAAVEDIFFLRLILFVKLVTVFATVEGIFPPGSSCAIFWLKKRILVPDLSCNGLILRNKRLQCDFPCLVYS